ncbi:hypothetical protein JTE90_001397 [Oedothorax gibbosus]|uniref:MULE transposase domain-containing protein n=1 Tax=Oedothorax gibbosus TaxID=931172 RepID=A0AAV6VGY7_9ARAC|nr:hypothetical protein JTE90_001397 [Oedothorax gibbosus]
METLFQEFNSYDDFKVWKEVEEKKEKCFFSQMCGVKKSRGVKKYYFACHRSGYYSSKGKGLRNLKIQGSCRLNTLCPASIKLTETETGNCHVEYNRTHVGHQSEDLGHLALTDKERKSIAEKIAMKLPFSVILDGIRDTISSSGLERLQLLTNKDLHNIGHSFNVGSEAKRHPDDGTSVEAWVNEMNADPDSCVLFYKPQGVTCSNFPLLKSEDFALVIMSEAQKVVLQKFANDCICVDGTHGMNSYGFELVSILVIDELRQGFPGAFFITNRTDEDAIAVFFSCLKSKVGTLKPKVFMSDMAEAFYNAWLLIMDKPLKRLFCTWHVDKSWRKNLSKVKGKEKKASVYKTMRTLLEERDEQVFKIEFHGAMKKMLEDEDTAEFGIYINENYSKNVESWAYCYRIYSGLNTNMHIESMHNTLKNIHLKGENVKRLDKSIQGIMKLARSKLIERLITSKKGKVPKKLSVLRDRHEKSIEMKSEVNTDGHLWKISSSSTEEKYMWNMWHKNAKIALSTVLSAKHAYTNICAHALMAVLNTICANTFIMWPLWCLMLKCSLPYQCL